MVFITRASSRVEMPIVPLPSVTPELGVTDGAVSWTAIIAGATATTVATMLLLVFSAVVLVSR